MGTLLLPPIYGVITLTLVLVPYTLGADPVLTPETVTDQSGNTADAKSNIVWAPLPTKKPYASDDTYDNGGLGPWFGLARSFINTAMPGEFPYDMITGLIKGTFDIGSQYMEIVNLALGFAICVVIGLLYIFIMPIIGCCICCCRCCCGNCGGGKRRRRKDTDNKYRIIFSIILLIIALFTFVGALCVFVTNGRVPASLDYLESAITNNIDDLQGFLKNTVKDLEHVAGNNYDFTKAVVTRDLDNIGYILGIGTRDKLGKDGGIDAALDSLLAFDAKIKTVGAALKDVDKSVTDIKSAASTLKSDLAAVKSDIDSAKSGCTGVSTCDNLDTSVLTLDVDFNNLPDISSQVSKMDDVLKKDLKATILTGKADFDNIPARVTTETKSVVKSVKDLMDSLSTTIDSALDEIRKLPNQLDSGQINDMKTELENYRTLVAPYDTYRFAAGVVLACVILLVVVLQVLGVVLGFCGYDDKKEAHKRSQLSDSSGRILLASSGFVFIFSWLLMLLTVILFLVGALLEKFLCQPLADPDFTIFKKLFDTPGSSVVAGDGYFLGNLILQNSSIDLTVSGVLKGCQENKAAISVLKLDTMFDLSQVTDYKKNIDIDSEIAKINIDLSTVKLLDASTESQLNEFSTATQIDYAKFETELAKDTAKTDLGTFASKLRTVANTPGLPSASATKFNDAATKVDDIKAGSFKSVNDKKAALSADVASLKSATASIPADVNKAIANVKTTETYMANSATAVIKKNAGEYGQRILGVVDSFANDTLTKVYNDVGACKPVFNLYYSIFVIGLCKYIVDVLNGFWLALGWAIFFETIGVIFSIKLAKFLLRMRVPDDDDSTQYTRSEKSDADLDVSSLDDSVVKVPIGDNVIESDYGSPVVGDPQPVTAMQVAEANGSAGFVNHRPVTASSRGRSGSTNPGSASSRMSHY